MSGVPSHNIIGGDAGTRQARDFYPTPPEVTRVLGRYLGPGPLSVWDPAAGDGAMVRTLTEMGYNVWGSDIERDQDFLAYALDRSIDWIVTNPPFKLAEPFIRRAIDLNPARGVAILTKSQFWHAKSRTPLFRELPPQYVIALNWRPDFMKRGAPTMDFIWNIWLPYIWLSSESEAAGATTYIVEEKPREPV